jgi:putative oxidoreductase
MSNSSNTAVPLIGRALLSILFLVSFFLKVTGYSQMVGYATAKGMPMAGVGVAIAAVLELVGGIAILTGFQTRIVAWIMFLYIIPTTYFFHNFWMMTGMERQDNMAHFLKNLAIMGGLLILAANGPGAYSLDERSSAKA